eukprot:TRINITY_DN9042_c0_g1_i1.p1 TRINITY_DN9042_c0_g1~~TRINITY_DN9042_c0_g1_i1.p1  ORF type:complete len:152 (+),score=39.80 TRINITY_DN9042_c0_g1_i1:113-568(+)
MPATPPAPSRRAGARLILHGTGTTSVGVVIAGLGFLDAIYRNLDAGRINQWRVAHSGSVSNGLLCFAAAAALHFISLSEEEQERLSKALSIAAWGNTLGYTLGAVVGHRGLKLEGPPANGIPFACFGVAVPTVIYGLAQLLRGARRAMSEP